MVHDLNPKNLLLDCLRNPQNPIIVVFLDIISQNEIFSQQPSFISILPLRHEKMCLPTDIHPY